MSSEPKRFIAYRALVGQVVAQRRNALGMGQLALAGKLGITQASMSRLETGQSAFSVEQLAVAADALGVTPQHIIGQADQFARLLEQQGNKVLRTVQDAQPDWSPLVGAALMALLVGLALSSK